jgi:hypothetical protein
MHKYLLAGAVSFVLLGMVPAFAQQPCPRSSAAVNLSSQCGARFGNDLREVSGIANQNACQYLCDGDNKCVAWTYVIAGRSCQLKTQEQDVVNDNCCFTGIKN